MSLQKSIKKFSALLVAIVLPTSLSTVFAEELSAQNSALHQPTSKIKKLQIDRFYSGFGVSDHKSTISTTSSNIANGDALGFAIFAGYTLPYQPTDYTKLSVEAGYLSTQNFDWDSGIGSLSSADSILTSALVEFNIVGQWQILARAGYDFGDDQSNFFGGGVGYLFHNGLNLRTEYMEQDKIDTLQINITMRVKDILF